MTHTPKIRALAPHEWRIHKDLRLRALADSPQAFGSTLAEAQARPDDAWESIFVSRTKTGWNLTLVAEVDGKPVGMAVGHIDPADPHVANLFSVWVDPTYRQTGTGMRLVEAVIEWARSRHARYLDLGVAYADSPAMRLYRRLGFEPTGRPVPFREGSEALGLNMRLDLERSKAEK